MSSVFIIGLRGIPGVQGGIETHVENLAPLLVNHGIQVTILARKGFQPRLSEYQGVKIKTLWSPKSKFLEAIVHTFFGIMYATVKRPDILHIHAIGPSILTPIARIVGLKVVMTHHGPDYDRQKWGNLAKFILRLGEKLGTKFSNQVIVISNTINRLIYKKHKVNGVLIPNGVKIPDIAMQTSLIDKLGLEQGRYILLVSRLVPEKRHHDLIDAFLKSEIKNWKLVLVGSSDHPDSYSQSVLEKAKNTSGVITPGFLKGRDLNEIYSHAGLFVLPSSHEGLPIALLEALSFGLPTLASDIPSNKEVDIQNGSFFELGNIEALSKLIIEFTKRPLTSEQRNLTQEFVRRNYDWQKISIKTLKVYINTLGKNHD